MFKRVDKIPISVLLPLAVIILLAPFDPLPHALDKLMMLKNGTLRRPLDIFDLCFHLLPAMLLIIKSIHLRRLEARKGS